MAGGTGPVKTIPLKLFTSADPTSASIDVKLAENANCHRHQLTLTCVPEGTTGTVTVKGIGWQSALPPAHIDSRLDAASMAGGNLIIIFYGQFDALHFDFAGFAAGKKMSAHLISQQDLLTYSGNAP